MNLIKPNQLKIGDKITIIAPSGPVNIDIINKAKEYFENKGYKVEFGKNLNKKCDYLAGSDKDRLEDLHNAFKDIETKAIICARGGYGALRLLDKIDYEIIKNNPKIFCGYSDITLLNAMFLKRANLITFSGPMAQSDFGADIDTFTEKSFFNTVSNNICTIKPNNPIAYLDGNAQGILFGGNLASLSSLCGIEFVPNEDFIFFAEDLNEPVYKIDRYFTQLLSIPAFKKNIKAIILGDFLDIDNQNYFDNYFENLGKELNIPIISGYPISHSKMKATVPYGAYCELKDNTLEIKDYFV
jgi:muramoyltetrapeptide carboxypeptidase